MARRLAATSIVSPALLVARQPIGEADLIARFFTAEHGMIGAVARNARRSQKRFAALEPMHGLRVRIDVSPLRDLGTLSEAVLERPRLRLTSRLDALQAAGRALGWVRRVGKARAAEPALWREINGLLDALDALPEGKDGISGVLAGAGLRMLAAAGWALELGRCVRCGKPCPETGRAILDVGAGGIVCRSCGGTGPVLSAAERRSLLRAQNGTETEQHGALHDAERALGFIERAIDIHARGEST